MSKPILRTDAYYDLQSIIADGLARIAAENHIYRSCINCFNFNEKNELCKLANQRPPAKVIVFGCRMWDDKDGIPF